MKVALTAPREGRQHGYVTVDGKSVADWGRRNYVPGAANPDEPVLYVDFPGYAISYFSLNDGEAAAKAAAKVWVADNLAFARAARAAELEAQKARIAEYSLRKGCEDVIAGLKNEVPSFDTHFAAVLKQYVLARGSEAFSALAVQAIGEAVATIPEVLK